MAAPNQAACIESFRRDLRVLEREIVRQLEGETTCCGVTLTQCHALLELAVADLSLTALAKALNLDSSTLSRTVETMVKAGWVERATDPADRRLNRLSLTQAGQGKVAGINRTCNRYYGGLLEKFTLEQRQELLRAIHLLATVMSRGEMRAGAVCSGLTEFPKSRGGKRNKAKSRLTTDPSTKGRA